MGKDKNPFQPRRLGKFLLLDHIASGGMAELYRAKTVGASGFEKLQAVKSIYPQYTNNEDFRKMFEREAQICSQLQHANIVQVMDFIRVGENFLLSMEFVDGKNARQILGKAEKQREKIPVEMAAFIIMEVCRGLDYAHKKKDPQSHEPLKIIHRDVSPQNIMISYEGSVKIVDFGIAKARNQTEITRSGVVKGKFAYMSPEQASGADSIDHRTDIFSAGIVLYELLSQERLFAADDDLQTIRRINECEVPKVSRANPNVIYDLEKVVFKALAKDPEQRFQSAADMAMALQRIIVKNWEWTTAEHVGQWVRKLFAEDILEERKRLRRQEELAREIGQHALESVRDTLMPTDGDYTKIKQEKETRISAPPTQHVRTKQLTEPTVANNGVSDDPVTLGESTSNSELLNLTSFTQMNNPVNQPSKSSSNLEEDRSKRKAKIQNVKVGTSSESEQGDSPNVPSFEGSTDEKTQPQNMILTRPGGEFSPQQSPRVTTNNGESLEVMPSHEYTSNEFQKISTQGQLARMRPAKRASADRSSQKSSKKGGSAYQIISRIALGLILLGLIGYAVKSKRNESQSPSSDPCLDDPEKCLAKPTDTPSPVPPPTKLPNPKPEAQPDPGSDETRDFSVPLNLPPKIVPFDISAIPEQTRDLVKKHGGVDFGEIANRKINMKMYPDGTEVQFNKKVIGQTPFIWNVPETIGGADTLVFSKPGFIGLSMRANDFILLLQDRRTGSNVSDDLYAFVLEYNLDPILISVIDIFVHPVANIYIDGGEGPRYVGQSPLINYEVKAGKYQVKLVNQLLNLERTYTISVPPGKHLPPFKFSLTDRMPTQSNE